MGYLVVRHGAVSDLMRDRRLRPPGELFVQLLGASSGPFFDLWTHAIINTEGEEHARLRRLVAGTFTPRAAERARPMMRSVLKEVIDQVAPRGACDFVTDLCDPYPIRVICQLIGVGEEDVPTFHGWAESMSHIYDMKPETLPEIDAAVAGMFEYVGGIIAERRSARNPPDDLVQSLIDAEAEGDRLTFDELRTWLVLMLVAGFDNTKNQLTFGMLAFLEHPEEWQRLAADPALVPGAVEEIMRWIPAVGAAPRIATEDFDYDGLTIPTGTLLLVSPAAAGRDPTAYPDPLRFDITRRGESHLTLGAGTHYCTGALIARAELEEAFRALAPRLRDIRLAGEPVWRSPLGAWGLSSLPMTFAAD
jgi:cytochrome P450